jgi:hypothetical protein
MAPIAKKSNWMYDPYQKDPRRCPMKVTANELLAAYDALSPDEQQQVAVKIIRRSSAADDLPAAGLDELAAELFRAYDAEEAKRANP